MPKQDNELFGFSEQLNESVAEIYKPDMSRFGKARLLDNKFFNFGASVAKVTQTIPLYTHAPDSAAIIAKLEADKAELLEALKELIIANDNQAKAYLSAEVAKDNYSNSQPELNKLNKSYARCSIAEHTAKELIAKNKNTI